MFSVSNLLKCFILVLLTTTLWGCGGDNGKGNQTALLVCDGFDIILENGQCGIPPQLVCEAPEVLVDGACIIPDDPDPIYKPAADEAVIYYNRRDKNFDGWSLHLWSDCSDPSKGSWDGANLTANFTYSGAGTDWPEGPTPNFSEFGNGGVDPIYGAYWVLKLQDNADCGNLIIHTLDGGVQTTDLAINFSDDPENPYANMFWVLVDSAAAETDLTQAKTSATPMCINDVCQEFTPPPLIVENMAAHWIDATTIVWNKDLSDVMLYGSTAASLGVDAAGAITGSTVNVALTPATLTDEQIAVLPEILTTGSAYSLDTSVDTVKDLLKQQLYVVGKDTDEKLFGTQVQINRVLDAVYTWGDADANEAVLGPVYNGDSINVSLWAPTAQDVKLRIFERPVDSGLKIRTDEVAMTLDAATGVWSASGTDWDRKYYRFLVTVFNAQTGEVQQLEVQDPYSVSAAFNGTHSQFVNLSDTDIKPQGWDNHTAPTVANPESAVIYEGHIRDFSINDASTMEDYRGKYMAFTQSDSMPVQHLQALQASGLTHFHLLPTYDFASVEEDPFEQINLSSTVFELCEAVRPDVPDVCDGRESNTSTLQEVFASYDGNTDSARILADVVKDLDGFNWGYDPVFYNVPEGSYATDPRGEVRILEMRSMIKALHDMGLRAVMDVVYNHTSDRGVGSAKAIFDKIVPGYYYRRDVLTGDVENASCCNDTASENAMMAKLVVDSLMQWTAQYGIDSYRFDVMSLMPKQLIVDSLAAVQTIDSDTYFYGEGWNTSQSTADDAAFIQATQANMSGTGVGTFNDRMRDQMRFLNLVNGGDVNRLRSGLAGNLSEFSLVTSSGATIKASSDGGYTSDPQENVNYVEKHDNETLWDWIHQEGALPANTSLNDRVRIHNLTESLVLLSQGVPFIHMGSDLLRSKSMDGNSYNSGDWFNFLDFTMGTNNWMVGLPNPDGNNANDEQIINVFSDSEAKPELDNILFASETFNEFLKISSSTALFSLTTQEDVLDRVGFHNMGTSEVPGLIVMSIDDGAGVVTGTEDTARADLDANVDAVVVMFNGSADEISHTVITSAGFALHTAQQNSTDATVASATFQEAGTGENGGTFTVPAYTTAVFVKAQGAQQGSGLSAYATSGFEPAVPFGDTTVYVRGGMNGWSEDDALDYVGGGVYQAYIQVAAGSYEFKVASGDWSTVDLSTGDGSATVTIGENKNLGPGADQPNLAIEIIAGGEYLFTLNATDLNAPILTVTNAEAFPVTTYIRGSLNDWGTASPLAYIGRGVYQVTITGLDATEYEFKVASEDWSTVDISTADAGNLVVSEGEAKLLGAGADVSNMQFTPSVAGDYLFTINAANSDAPVLTVVNADPYGATAVHIRGDMNSWSTDDVLAFQGTATYSKTLTLTAGIYGFKVASEDWATVNMGADDTGIVVVGAPVLLLQDSQTNFSIEILEDGTYNFSVNASAAQAVLLVTKVE